MEYNSKQYKLYDISQKFVSLHKWYLGWKARMAARAERKDEPEPKSKIKVISADEVPRGFIY